MPVLPDADFILTCALLLGGIPPMLSGIVMSSSPETYTNFVAPGVVDTLAPKSFDLWLWCREWMLLQGGDAFVAGASRVFAALSPIPPPGGSFDIRRAMAAIGIFHSIFEIIVLPDATTWSQRPSVKRDARPNDFFTWLVTEFIVLHILLVVAFSYGLFGPRRRFQEEQEEEKQQEEGETKKNK